MREPLIYHWDTRILSIGRTDLLAPHTHATAELVVSFDTAVHCKTAKGEAVRSLSLLIPPGLEHQNTHVDPLCPVLYLDPEGGDYESLSSRLGNPERVVSLGGLEGGLRRLMLNIYQKKPSSVEVDRLLNIALFGESVAPDSQRDARVEAVVELIKTDLSASISVEELASGVHLSTDRLLHLFKSQIGVPLRQYRTWLRLREASKLVREGLSMTLAAHQAGFFDSAHFSRAFKRQFGVSPRGMQKRFMENL